MNDLNDPSSTPISASPEPEQDRGQSQQAAVEIGAIESTNRSLNVQAKHLFPAPVAAVLLAHSRDLRHHSSLSRMLLACIVPHLVTCIKLALWRESTLHQESSIQQNLVPHSRRTHVLQWQRMLAFAILPEIHLISNIVHSFITIIRSKQSLGMESLRLHLLRQGHPIRSSATDTSVSQDDASLKHTENSSINAHHAESPWKSISFRFFFFIYSTLVPYLLHRASIRRQGWKDIQQVVQLTWNHGLNPFLRSVYSRLGLFTTHSLPVHDPSLSLSSSPSPILSSQHGQEGLRGEERKQVFLEMRRKMKDRAVRISDTLSFNTQMPISSLDLKIENPTMNNSNHGLQPDDSSPTPSIHQRFNKQDLLGMIAKYRIYFWNVLRHVVSAMEDLSGSTSQRHSNPLASLFPMELDSDWIQGQDLEVNQQENRLAVDNTDHRSQDDDVSSKNSIVSTCIYWLLQFHLALFYIHGKYPTLLHRFTKTQMFVESNTQTIESSIEYSSSLKMTSDPCTITRPNGVQHPSDSNPVEPCQRPSYRLIGYLILFDGAMKLIKAAIKKVVEVSLAGSKNPFSSSRSTQNTAKALVSSIEAKVPSFHSQQKEATFSTTKSLSSRRPKATSISSSAAQCAICLNDRTHPACPKTCGHVFCWSCLQRWLSTVRMECPFCRTLTRPQDIIPLYHYEP